MRHLTYPSFFVVLLLCVIGQGSIVLLETSQLLFSGTDGGDSYYYYTAAVDATKGGSSCFDSLAPGFVCFQYLALSAAPFSSFYEFVLILLSIYTLNSVLLTRISWGFIRDFVLRRPCMINIDALEMRYRYYMFILLVNPIIIYTVARGLKEILFFVAFTLYMSSMYTFFLKQHIRSFAYFMLGITLLFVLKPGGVVYFVLPYAISLFAMAGWKNRFLVIFSLIPFMLMFMEEISSIVDLGLAHQDIVIEEGVVSFSPDIFTYLTAPLRFLLGPGPFRSLIQIIMGDVFIVSTHTGDVLIFIGSVIWWIALFLIAKSLFVKSIRYNIKCNINRNIFNLLWFAFFYMAVYSVAYFGSGDTRHRAALYFSLAPLMSIILALRTIKVGTGASISAFLQVARTQ